MQSVSSESEEEDDRSAAEKVRRFDLQRVGSAKLLSASERNIGAVAYPGASE